MKATAEAGREFENAIVTSQNEDVPRRIEDGGTDFAVLQMPLYQFSCLQRKSVVEKRGDVIPDVLAFDHH
jgi:hypothetical protein